MKRVIKFLPLLVFAFFFSIETQAQAPGMFNFQAVARDVAGKYITGPITVRITVSDGVNTYLETHSPVVPNSYGLFSINIGGGTSSSPKKLAELSWSTSPVNVTVEVNPGTGFVTIGSQRLLSVPYALYANSAGNSTSGTTNTIRNGTTPPDPNLGNDGDFYIDNKNLIIYGPRVAGAWPATGTSMVGSGSGVKKNFTQGGGIKIDSVGNTIKITNTLTIDSLNTAAFVKTSTPPGNGDIGKVLIWDGNLWSFQPLNGTSTPVTVGAGLAQNGINNIRLNIDGSLDTTSGILKVTKSRLDTLAGGPLTDSYVIKVVGGKLELAPDDTSGTQGTGITNLNGQTAAIQTISLDTSATDFVLRLSTINTGIVDQHLGLPTLSNTSTVDRGLLSKSDYDKLIGGVGSGGSYTSKSLKIGGDTIGLIAGTTKGDVMTWDGGKWISTSTGVGYTIGSSLLLKTGNILVADSNKAIWNANRLLSKPVSKPVGGQYLSYDALKDSIVFVPAPSGTSQWITNANNTDIYYNNGKVGIGTASPTQELDVIGTVFADTVIGDRLVRSNFISGGNITSDDAISGKRFNSDSIITTPKIRIAGLGQKLQQGYVLTSDKDGNGTWELPGSGTSFWTPRIPGSPTIVYSNKVGIGTASDTLTDKLTIYGGLRADSVYAGEKIQTAFLLTDSMNYKKGTAFPADVTGYVLTAKDNTGKVIWYPAGNNSGWTLSGNDISSLPNSKMGTTSVHDLNIVTSNLPRVRVNGKTGNVSVAGGLNIDDKNVNNLPYGHIKRGSYLTFGHDSSGEGISSLRKPKVITTGPDGSLLGLDFFTNFETRMTIDHNGLIGIGTTMPQSMLHVGDGGQVQFNILGGADSSIVGVRANGVLFRMKTPTGSGVGYTKGVGINNLNGNVINADIDRAVWDAGKIGNNPVDTTITLSNNIIDNKKNLKWDGTKWIAQKDSLVYEPVNQLLSLKGSNTVNLQSLTGGWSLSGNANTASTNFIGTTDVKGFKIRTAGSTRMLIDSVGNFMLGGSPTTIRASFEQRGAVGSTSAIFGGQTTGVGLVTGAVTGIGFNQYSNAGIKAIGSGFSGYVALQVSNGDMIFGTAGSATANATPAVNSTKMTLNNAGNLGVGVAVTQPLTKIHSGGGFRADSLRGSDTSFIAVTPTGLLIRKAGNGGGAGGWSLTGNDASTLNADTISNYLGSASNHPVVFKTRGIERMRITRNGNVSINQAISSGYALAVNGKIKTSNITESSDVRLKKEIKPLENALENVKKLTGVSYKWRTDEYPEMKLEDGTDIGLIAQDVEKVLPELVNTDSKGYKSIEYSHLVALLIEAVKAQQKQIEMLNTAIKDKDGKVLNSENRIQSLESSLQTLNTQMQMLMEIVGSREGVKAGK